MIELIVWGCIAHCIAFKPVATMYVLDDVESVKQMCRNNHVPNKVIACTVWTTQHWYDTSIFIPADYLNKKSSNDNCGRSILMHEIFRATHHDPTYKLGSCSYEK